MRLRNLLKYGVQMVSNILSDLQLLEINPILWECYILAIEIFILCVLI